MGINDDQLRRDLQSLSSDVAKTAGATQVHIEVHSQRIASLEARTSDLDALRAAIERLDSVPDRLARLETSHAHVREDVTGAHRTRTLTDPAIEHRRIDVEKDKLVVDERKSERSGRVTVWAALIPGVLALFLQLMKAIFPGH